MDIKNLNIPTLDSPNWGTYSTHVQAATWILGFGDKKLKLQMENFLTIVGYGTIVGQSIMPNAMVSIQICWALYVLETNKWLYLLIATGQQNCVSTTMKQSMTVTQNGIPFIIRAVYYILLTWYSLKTRAKYLEQL